MPRTTSFAVLATRLHLIAIGPAKRSAPGHAPMHSPGVATSRLDRPGGDVRDAVRSYDAPAEARFAPTSPCGPYNAGPVCCAAHLWRHVPASCRTTLLAMGAQQTGQGAPRRAPARARTIGESLGSAGCTVYSAGCTVYSAASSNSAIPRCLRHEPWSCRGAYCLAFCAPVARWARAVQACSGAPKHSSRQDDPVLTAGRPLLARISLLKAVV